MDSEEAQMMDIMLEAEGQSAGETGHRSDISDEEQMSGGSNRHVVQAKSQAADATRPQQHNARFADTFANILGKRVRNEKVPILSGVNLTEDEAEMRAERTEKFASQKATAMRRLLRNRAHVTPESATDERERALQKIATTGVIKLFNAVAEAQRVADTNTSSSTANVAELSRGSFMQLLTDGSGERNQGMATPMPAAATFGGDKPGWDALNDDYMLTSKKIKQGLKEWNHGLASSSSDEEEQEQEEEQEEFETE